MAIEMTGREAVAARAVFNEMTNMVVEKTGVDEPTTWDSLEDEGKEECLRVARAVLRDAQRHDDELKARVFVGLGER